MIFSKSRLETFSDGVIAIVITIMVLNIPLPDTFGLPEIIGLLKSILIFFVSFCIVGYFWSSHHFMMEQISEVSSTLIWRNLLFLFFLALIPIFTKWVMLHSSEVVPAIGYDIVFLLATASMFWIGSSTPVYKKRREEFRAFGGSSLLRRWLLLFVVVCGIIVLSFFFPRVSLVFFIGFPVVFSIFNLVFERTRDVRVPESSL